MSECCRVVCAHLGSRVLFAVCLTVEKCVVFPAVRCVSLVAIASPTACNCDYGLCLPCRAPLCTRVAAVNTRAERLEAMPAVKKPQDVAQTVGTTHVHECGVCNHRKKLRPAAPTRGAKNGKCTVSPGGRACVLKLAWRCVFAAATTRCSVVLK